MDEPETTLPERFPSPNHGLLRPVTLGVIVHSTRSGNYAEDALEREYQGTINWFLRPDSWVSAHRVIGYYEGQYAECVDDATVAWHAGEHNAYWLGVELCQPLPTVPFSDWQYDVLVQLIREWSAKYNFPLIRGGTLLGHEEMPQGQRAGKSDPGKMFDWVRLCVYLGIEWKKEDER